MIQRLRRMPVYPEEARPVAYAAAPRSGDSDGTLAELLGRVADLGAEVARLRAGQLLAFRLQILQMLDETGRIPTSFLPTIAGNEITTTYARVWTNDRKRVVHFQLLADWTAATNGAVLRLSRLAAESGLVGEMANPGTRATTALSCLLKPDESVYVRDGGTVPPVAGDVMRPGIRDFDEYLIDSAWQLGVAKAPEPR